jgi:RNA polymerase sigma factor (sigma-70 family)
MNEVIHYLRRAVLPRSAAEQTDGQLLEGFVRCREGAALEILIRRHGPMVWGVCRRLLSHHDAEDAFQATFLVLVRKAASVVPRELVANWLYGVAHQTARKARATAAKKRARERQVHDVPEPEAAGEDRGPDLRALLDRELSRLPDKYRVPIILCDLEGKTRKEAARQLGWPEGTVASRQARARALLAKRLARHGLSLSAGSLPSALAQGASACVPPAVVSDTIQAATLLAASPASAAAVISAEVAALCDGVLTMMWWNKIKTLGVVLLLALGLGAGLWAHRTQAGQPPAPDAAPDEKPGQNEKAKATADTAAADKGTSAAVLVTLRVGRRLKYDHVQQILRGLRDVTGIAGIHVTTDDTDPGMTLAAQIQFRRKTPHQAVAKVVEVLLSNGVRTISIGDANAADTEPANRAAADDPGQPRPVFVAPADAGTEKPPLVQTNSVKSMQDRMAALEKKVDRLTELVMRLVEDKGKPRPNNNRY